MIFAGLCSVYCRTCDEVVCLTLGGGGGGGGGGLSKVYMVYCYMGLVHFVLNSDNLQSS